MKDLSLILALVSFALGVYSLVLTRRSKKLYEKSVERLEEEFSKKSST